MNLACQNLKMLKWNRNWWMYVNKLQTWWIKIHTFVIFINWQDGRYDIWEFDVYQDFNSFDLFSFNHTSPDT